MLDWRSAGLFMTAEVAWRRRIFIGGLLLLVPVVGWPLVLGYRRWVIERLVNGDAELVPPWRGNLRAICASGLGAMAVIHAWYSPLYLWIGGRVVAAGGAGGTWWIVAAALAFALPIFSTLIIPAMILWLRFGANSPPGVGELMGMSAGFTLITFVIPAGFLQVSRTGRLVSAFRIDRDLTLIATHLPRYVEAWIGSGIMSLLGHLCLPLAPFGVVWCYLGIVYSFNEVPADGPDAVHPRRSWFRYFRDEHWRRYAVERNGIVERYTRVVDAGDGPVGGGDPAFEAIRFGSLRVPLPRIFGHAPGKRNA